MRRFDILTASASLLLALSISGYPMVAIAAQVLSVDTQTVTVPFRAMMFALSLFLVVLGLAYRRYRIPPRLLPLVFFWVVYSFRLSEAVVLGGDAALSVRQPVDYLLFGWGLCLVPMLALLRVYPESTFRRGLNLTFGLALLTGIGFLGVLLTGRTSFVGARAGFEALNPISYGQLGASLALLGMLAFLGAERGVLSRLLPASAGILGLFLVGLSGSRSPLVELVVVGAVVLSSREWRRRLGRATVLMLVVLLAGSALMRVSSRVASGEDSADDSIVVVTRLATEDEPRIQLWKSALRLFVENPLFGSGLEDPEMGTYPHNLFLGSFMATGVFGGLAATLAFLFAIATSIRLARGPTTTAWVGILFLQYLIGGLFSGSLWASTQVWTFLGAAYGLQMAKRDQTGSGEP